MKKWYQSKLIWLGVAQMLTAIGQAVMSGSVDWRSISSAVIGAGVIVLRSVTDTGIGSDPK